MNPRLPFAVCLLLAPLAALAKGTLVSGPMLGYQAYREVLIWLETKDAKSVELDYWIAGQPETLKKLSKSRPRTFPAGTQPMKFAVPLLTMGANYEYSITVDGEKVVRPYPLTFKTRPQWEWRTPPPDFKFIFGSCAYLNETIYDRPGTPYGKGNEIFSMAGSGADFMVWGGDNWYLREADFSSESGIWYRYSHDRANPELQRLYATMHHYATWDDHDYGSNDSNQSFELKDVSLAAFKAYWGNASWGEADNRGVYGKFFWGDAAFFLMDNRYHRDDDLLDETSHPNKSQYGARQKEWLKAGLIHAQKLEKDHARFKFIVTGGQVLTDFGGASETFAYYTREREELLKFIVDQRITGVIFLTGDVHFTELARKIGATQWAYELTSSPLSSGASNLGTTERKNDPQRVPGTLVVDQNFCTLALGGPDEARVVTIACFDKSGAKRWERTIAAAELK